MGFWDRFGHGDRFKFVNPGDTIEGTIMALSATDFGGTADPTPVITIRTEHGDQDVTASQRVLITKLAEASPEIGDWIKITYDGESDKTRPGRSPAKLFTVTVKSGDRTPPEKPDVPDAWKDQSDAPF